MFILRILQTNAPVLDRVIILFAFLLSVVTAIVLHELAHGIVAKWNGDLTAQYAGRLTLNPAKHFDIFGLLMFLLCGFGWAKPVPINPYNFKNYKKGLVTTSLAGVCVNLIIAILSCFILWGFISIWENFTEYNFWFYLVMFIVYFFLYNAIINTTLIAFNLLPIAPLDGFRLVEALTKPNNAYVTFMRQYGGYILLGLVVIGNIFPVIDVFGYYIGWVQSLFFRLFNLIIGRQIF